VTLTGVRSKVIGAPHRAPQALPKSLQVLVEDDRFPNPVRHLRRLYTDRSTRRRTGNRAHWRRHRRRLFQSTVAPLKRANFPTRYAGFEAATEYDQWRFVFVPPPLAARAVRAPQPNEHTMIRSIEEKGLLMKRRILIVEDHSLLRQGLRSMVGALPDFWWSGRPKTARRLCSNPLRSSRTWF